MVNQKEESIFLELIGDNPRTKLLEYLIIGRNFDYTLTDMKNAGISWTTLNRIFPDFLEKKIVAQTRRIGRIKLYKINMENFFVKKIVGLFDSLMHGRIEEVSKVAIAKMA